MLYDLQSYCLWSSYLYCFFWQRDRRILMEFLMKCTGSSLSALGETIGTSSLCAHL